MRHAQWRLWKRYHIRPTRAVFRRIKDMIRYRSKNIKFIRPGRGPTEIYLVPIGRKMVVVLWNWREKSVTTFLPRQAA